MMSSATMAMRLCVRSQGKGNGPQRRQLPTQLVKPVHDIVVNLLMLTYIQVIVLQNGLSLRVGVTSSLVVVK